nr:hypothetical protein [Paracoccus saliphilus]
MEGKVLRHLKETVDRAGKLLIMRCVPVGVIDTDVVVGSAPLADLRRKRRTGRLGDMLEKPQGIRMTLMLFDEIGK